MKKVITLLAFVALFATTALADITVDGKSYAVDTIIHRQVGPGMMHSVIRLPSWPLNVYISEMDVTNPNNRVESTFSRGRLGQLEALDAAAVRNRTATKRPIVLVNGNFWVVSTSQPWASFQLDYPLGGVVRNDTTVVNPNTTYDQWNYGPGNTGSAVVDREGRVYMGPTGWRGTVSHPAVKDGVPQEFQNVNRRAVAGEMCLFNGAYGVSRPFANNWTSFNTTGDNQSDNYFLRFKEGEDWRVGQEMHFEVVRVVLGKDRLALGAANNYDAALTCTGASKELMSPVQKGDELVINIEWTMTDAAGNTIYPKVENLVEGNATVMTNGELTPRNYNEGYNTSVYSRTAYATNADGTKLYFIVIDKSQSPDYGRSNGATTAQMCQVLKSLCPEVTDIVNFDAGGSALMYVDGDYANTSTENTARRVSCGWMMEAVGEEDNQIASIAFADYQKKMPVYSSYTPVIWGYNARGEIVDHDVKGFTLSCDSITGRCDGQTFYASGVVQQSYITATLDSMSAQIKVITQEAEPAIKLKPTLVIDDRDYPVEVIAAVNGETFFYDPSSLQWNIADPTVAYVTNGTLRGVTNGQTQLNCQIDELKDSTMVSVEISDTPYRYEDWTGWTVKGSGHKNFNFTSEGVLTYTYGTSRVPYIALDKDLTFFGLPDTIAFAFKSSVPIDRMQMDVRNYNFTKTNNMVNAPEGGFAADEWHTVFIDLATLGGTDKVGTYPINLKEIRFEPTKGLDATESTLEFTPIRAHYDHVYTLGDVTGDGSVDIDDCNVIINIMIGKNLEPSYVPRADLDHNGMVDIDDLNMIINIMLGKYDQ